MDRVVERLDAEAIASGEQYLVALIPDRECELAAQRMNRAGAPLLEQVQRDLAVGPRTERVSLLLELAADPLEVIELAIRDDVKPLVFVRDGLVTRRQVDDAQSGVAESGATTSVYPNALRIGPAMLEPPGRPVERLRRHPASARYGRYDPAHI